MTKVYTMGFGEWMLALTIGVIFLLRKIPVIGIFWKIIEMFLIVALAVLTANFIKTEVKKWWEK
jgi:hypothetical protein